MGMMFSWATKEYILWEMSLGQLVMYHNIAIDIKNGTVKKGPKKLSERSPEELKRIREELRQKYGAIDG